MPPFTVSFSQRRSNHTIVEGENIRSVLEAGRELYQFEDRLNFRPVKAIDVVDQNDDARSAFLQKSFHASTQVVQFYRRKRFSKSRCRVSNAELHAWDRYGSNR
jgi:hypothetical protein